VSDVLELDAGVGYGTGNLVFPGSVVVKGVVSDGFRLVAGGSITIKGPLDASEVMCHGDLTCEGGIIGKTPGLVRAGGKVKALFVEHCQVESLGSITVTKALLHAKVYTNDNLILEEGGRVVSTSVWVKGSLTCSQLGGENGPAKVVAGSDFVVQRKMETIRSRHRILEQEMAKEKAPNREPSPEKVAALGALVAEINALTPLLFCNPATEIRVSGRVFEGTVIEMGYAALTVTRQTKAQSYRLSPDGKTVIAAPLTKDAKESAPTA